MQADEQGATRQKEVRAGFVGREEEQSKVQGKTGDNTREVWTADARDGTDKLLKLILRGADEQRQQTEGGLFSDGKESADPDDETDDNPEADGAEGAVFHRWSEAWSCSRV